MKKTNIALGLVTAALLGSVAAVPAMAQDETLRIRLNADIRSTEPGINRDSNSDAVVMNIVEGLVGFRDDMSVAPLLAESIDVSEDGTVYTFHLRDDAMFSNGEPLTSAEVLFSWEHYSNPESGWRCLPDVNGEGVAHVTGVEATDDHTVVFTLAEPSALFLTTLARADCGGMGIIHPDSVGTDGEWIEPISTGPFALGEWRSGQYVELVRNEHYAALEGEIDGYVGDKTPLVDTVRFIMIPDDSAAKAALYADNIDIIFDVNNADVPELSSSDQFNFDMVPGMSLVTLNFQTRDPLMSDPRMRKALLYSLDLPQIVEVISGGLAEPSFSVIPTPSAYYTDVQAQVPERDLEQARALLAEAGYGGEPIFFQTTEYFPGLADASVLVQAMALEAGINIQIETYDWPTLEQNYTSGEFQAMTFSYSARVDPSLSFSMMSGDKDEMPNKIWENPEALALQEEAARISDPEERQAVLDELDALFREDVPMIPLYSGNKGSATRADVEGYKTWPIGFPRAWGVTVGNEG